MACVKEVAPLGQAVPLYTKAQRTYRWQWFVRRFALHLVQQIPGILEQALILSRDGPVPLACGALLADHRQRHLAHAPGGTFFTNMLHVGHLAAHQACRVPRAAGSLVRVKILVGGVCQVNYLECHPFCAPIHDRLERELARARVCQPPLAHQRHLGATRGVGAAHRARPQVTDDGPFAGGVGVQVADLLARPLQHPLAPLAHVRSQRIAPGLFGQRQAEGHLLRLLLAGQAQLLRSVGAGRRHPLRLAVLLGIDERAQLDQVRDGVQLDGVGLAAQAQRLQPGRAAAHERVEQPRRPVGERAADQLAGLLDGLGVAVLHLVPVHDDLDQLFQLFALGVVLGRGDQRREDRRAHRGQRPPRPPDVQRGDVPVADGLLPRRLLADGSEGEGDFDETFGSVQWLIPVVCLPTAE